MRAFPKRPLFRFLVWVLPVALLSSATPAGQQHSGTETEGTQQPVLDLIEQPYVALFEKATRVRISPILLASIARELEQERGRERQLLRVEKNGLRDQIDTLQKELRRLNEPSSASDQQIADRREELHTRIKMLRARLTEVRIALDKGLDIVYENKLAKLRVLEEWPDKYESIQAGKLTGKGLQRPFADYQDIGFRDGVFANQEKDIKTGREVIRELKLRGLFPPFIEDPAVLDYTRDLANRIAGASDLGIPLEIAVLNSEEINAFALPGGFLFVNSGLMLKAETESELAGVLAHEVSHAAARHGHRLMVRANIAGIVLQSAQIAALILTGGVTTLGTYFALQYGFYGLGFALSLTLLGVNRDYEIEADVLGTQYLWNAGYDPKGFIHFVDKMTQQESYVTGLSWFRTHPPFYKRMEHAFTEILILPELEDPVTDSEEFHAARNRLRELVESEERDSKAPTLKRPYENIRNESGPPSRH